MQDGLVRNIGFFLAGTLLGGVAVALTTPLTGRRARRMVGKQIDRGSKQAERTARRVQDSSRNAYARGGALLHKAGELTSQAVSLGR